MVDGVLGLLFSCGGGGFWARCSIGWSGEVGAARGGTMRKREGEGNGRGGGRSAVGKERGAARFVCAGKWGKLSGKGGIWG